MSKHTPGRWYWDFDSDGNWSLRSDSAGEGIMDRRSCPLIEDRILIESAPVMFEALIDARRALELANFTGELAVVDAAIARAKGESS